MSFGIVLTLIETYDTSEINNNTNPILNSMVLVAAEFVTDSAGENIFNVFDIIINIAPIAKSAILNLEDLNTVGCFARYEPSTPPAIT